MTTIRIFDDTQFDTLAANLIDVDTMIVRDLTVDSFDVTANYIRIGKTLSQSFPYISGAPVTTTITGWDSPVQELLGDIKGTFDTATGIFTCAAGGIYDIHIFMNYAINTAPAHCLEVNFTNDGPVVQKDSLNIGIGAFGNNFMSHAILNLNTGDTLKIDLTPAGSIPPSPTSGLLSGATLQIIRIGGN